jgi:hypothetical protein
MRHAGNLEIYQIRDELKPIYRKEKIKYIHKL